VDQVTTARVVVSPLLELGAALHVLAAPAHHPEHADWAARVSAALPPALADDLAAWSFTVTGIRSAVFLRPGPGAVPTWASELAALRAAPPDAVCWALLRPLATTPGRRLPAGSPATADPAVRDTVRAYARSRPSEVGAVAGRLLDDPASTAAEFLDLLERCWEAFFAAEWDRVRPRLAAAVARAADTAAARGPLAPFAQLGPAVTVTDGRVVVDKVQSKRIAVGRRGLVLALSAFIGRHVLIGDDPPGPVVVLAAAPGGEPPRGARYGDVLRRLEALAHPDRIRICRAVATEERSAPEIAALWRMAPTRVTKHLTALRRAGVVSSRRRGHFVVYQLRLDALDRLGGDLLDALLR
jgi:DNA-binding transcriptional ArsR family regulator